MSQQAVMTEAYSRPAPTGRPLRGFGNIFQKELREWFSTRKFMITTILTTLMVASVPVIYWIHEGGLTDGQLTTGYGGLMEAWVALSLTLGSYLVVALTMGMFIKEEDAGTAQWLFTKPVSRSGYVLAKYAANCLAVLIGGVLVPGIVFLALMQAIQADGIQDWPKVLLAFGLIGFHACVAIAIVTGLSGIFRNAAPVAGIAIAMAFVPILFTDVVRAEITYMFPIQMGDIATDAALGESLSPWQPVFTGLGLIVISLVFTCRRIARRQL